MKKYIVTTLCALLLSAPIYAADMPDFVTAAGTHFMLDGKIFRFIGFNAYGMEGCYDGKAWTPAQLDAYFSKLPANGVTRIWAFRAYGTNVVRNILVEAAKYQQHVILTLGDDDSACRETEGAVKGEHSGKTLDFYQTGWKSNYLAWVNTIVPMFKNNASIMMWEIANEPGQAGVVPPEPVMRAYLKGASDAIRANDPNHLISVGANYAGNFGGTNNYIQAFNLPNINAVSFHDYSYEYEKGAVISGNFTTAKKASEQNNKPFYAGEAGVPSGLNCSNHDHTTLDQTSRVAFLEKKANAYLTGGAGGIDFWEYEPSRAGWVKECAYEIYHGDPMVQMVQHYKNL